MADPGKRDFFGLAKQLGTLVGVLALGLIVISAPIGALVYFKVNEQPGSETERLYRLGNTSDACIRRALTTVASDGAAAWANLRGKSSVSKVDELPIFRAAAAANGIPVALSLAIGKSESGFDPTRTSSAGAKGVLQLIPETFASMAPKGADPYDAKTSIEAGSKYLGVIYKRYKGDIRLTAAGYNAGPDNEYVKQGRVPPYSETQNYVQNVLAVYNEIAKCSELPNGTRAPTGTVGQQIAEKAKTYIGQSASVPVGAVCSATKQQGVTPNLFCSAFIADVINPLADTRLGASAPGNWEVNDGQRLYINSAYRRGDGDRQIALHDLQSGDYVFYATNDGIQHSAIYVGRYSGPAGYSSGDTTESIRSGNHIGSPVTTNSQQTVVGLKSSIEVYAAVDISHFGMSVIGVKRFSK